MRIASGLAPLPVGRLTSELVTVVGLDGSSKGWVAAALHDDGSLTSWLEPNATPLVDQYRSGHIRVLAIDMPIGLLDTHPRNCDVEARKLLGPRRSSIFPAPVRATLASTNYREACERSRQTCGLALSKQAFNLLPRIREIDDLVQPEDQTGIVEGHPECAFTRMAGRYVEQAKRTAQGRTLRLDLLRSTLPGIDELLRQCADLPVVDMIDALSLVVTARHVDLGSDRQLGDQTDATGLACRISY